MNACGQPAKRGWLQRHPAANGRLHPRWDPRRHTSVKWFRRRNGRTDRVPCRADGSRRGTRSPFLTVVLLPDTTGRRWTVRLRRLGLQVGGLAVLFTLVLAVGSTENRVAAVTRQNTVLRATVGSVAALHRQERKVRAEAAFFKAQTAVLARGLAELQHADTQVRDALVAAGVRPAAAPSSGRADSAPRGSIPVISTAPPAELAGLSSQATSASLAGKPLPGSQEAQAALKASHVLAAISRTVPDLTRNVAALRGSIGQWQQGAQHTPSIWPVIGPITSPFGWRPQPFGGPGLNFHEGVDIGVPVGTLVHATADGVVRVAGWNNIYGYVVVIDNGNGLKTLFGHNSRLLVSPGEHVVKGQVIADSGDTGWSTGPHVHYGIAINGTWVNPVTYLPGAGRIGHG